jgi:adenosylmethionine-8-amino-7-oxononanoate aminotransferase
MANLDIFEREGINEHVRENAPAFRAALEGCWTCRSSATSAARATSTGSNWSRTRRPARPSTTASASVCCAAICPRRCSTPGIYCRADDRGDPVIQLAPPLIIGQTEFDDIAATLRSVLEGAEAHL